MSVYDHCVSMSASVDTHVKLGEQFGQSVLCYLGFQGWNPGPRAYSANTFPHWPEKPGPQQSSGSTPKAAGNTVCVLSLNMASQIPHWPWTCHVAKDDCEHLILLPAPPRAILQGVHHAWFVLLRVKARASCRRDKHLPTEQRPLPQACSSSLTFVPSSWQASSLLGE